MHETSRALTVRVDEQSKTAKVVRELKHPKKLLSATQGGAQPLPNGNTFVGWGSQRYFSEYDDDGKLVFDAEFARGNDNYRAYRLPWEGRPAERPKVVASGSGGTVTAHGELERRHRASRAGSSWPAPSEDALEPVSDAEVDGFETTVKGRDGCSRWWRCARSTPTAKTLATSPAVSAARRRARISATGPARTCRARDRPPAPARRTRAPPSSASIAVSKPSRSAAAIGAARPGRLLRAVPSA